MKTMKFEKYLATILLLLISTRSVFAGRQADDNGIWQQVYNGGGGGC